MGMEEGRHWEKGKAETNAGSLARAWQEVRNKEDEMGSRRV